MVTYTQEKQGKYFGHDQRDFSLQSLGQLYLDEVKLYSPKATGKQSCSAHERQERKKQRKLVGWGKGKWADGRGQRTVWIIGTDTALKGKAWRHSLFQGPSSKFPSFANNTPYLKPIIGLSLHKDSSLITQTVLQSPITDYCCSKEQASNTWNFEGVFPIKTLIIIKSGKNNLILF